MLLASLLLLTSTAWAAPIIKTVGQSGDYRTIALALASISEPIPDRVEILLLEESYNETVLINKAGTAANPIIIRPAAGVTTEIAGTLTFGAGSRYVTVTGDNGSIPSGRFLTLRQTSNSRPTVQFTDDASNNTISQVRILGSSRVPTTGVVSIGSSVSSGNDNNVVTNNVISSASTNTSSINSLPTTLISSFNLEANGLNDGITITDNFLSNYSGNGVLVQDGNGSNWNVSNNKFFYDATVVPNTAQTAINFEPGTGSTNNTISGNIMGGRSITIVAGRPVITGTWVNTNAEFRGIVVRCGDQPSTTVADNQVSNVSLTSTTQPITALRLEDGVITVSNITITNVTNSGQGGVISLNSRTETNLSNFTVVTGQIVNVEVGGLLNVSGNLRNEGVLKNAGDVLVNGNFVNSTGTYNQTQGTLEIKGDMDNQGGTFTSVGGLVKLTGNRAQLASGGVYFNLEINGSGNKTITNDADIISQLTLLNGILVTGPRTVRLLGQANITESETSYVLGRLQASRTLQAGNTELFGGLGLELTPASSSVNPGVTDVLRVTGTASTAPNGRPTIKRYYDVTAVTNTGLNVNMLFRYLPSELNGVDPATIGFLKSINAGLTWEPRPATTSENGFATLNNVDSFSRWTLGDVQRPLPVGLTAFRAVRQGRQALVSWTTATELNNRGFGVEVSTDGRNFRNLGFVAAQAGSANAARNYQFLDQEEGKQGLRYYRLRQEDHDGKTSYYGPATVSFQDGVSTQLAAYPTSFEQQLTVEMTIPAATPVAFTLTDAVGRVVWQKTESLAAGFTQMQVAPQCPAGTYVLTARVNGTVLRQRVVRQ